ncbi:hypothetical protein ADL28_17935 [Streptomyces violaceusniger]|uniref:Uncharacterized protein n=1 Tax=Streptomyces violaceusniger TaxID=68280 RepID=A0A0X3WRZ2_STRVO|nr:hypothetical protein ADL28_17935 [Streptomyces violaceusniger]
MMDVSAKMLPWKRELTLTVAELPTCQNTLHACAPLMRLTELPTSADRAEPTWMMKTASGSPWASRVTVPVIPRVDVDV